ncbi:MAG: SIS domain-containing protein [Clostridia bacterium]|nr:SIS domain-containing protein [Clostridia bacterium]
MITETMTAKLIERYPALAPCSDDIKAAADMLIICFGAGGKVMCCGNGGSSADSDHFVGELMKGFLKKRALPENEKAKFETEALACGLQKGLPALSLSSQTALITAFNNDCEPDFVYAQQVYALAGKNDVLIVFSTSGNSANIVYALEAANAAGIKTIAVTGESGGRCAAKADICIKIPSDETCAIQELTLPVYHCIAAAVEEYFFSE